VDCVLVFSLAAGLPVALILLALGWKPVRNATAGPWHSIGELGDRLHATPAWLVGMSLSGVPSDVSWCWHGARLVAAWAHHASRGCVGRGADIGVVYAHKEGAEPPIPAVLTGSALGFAVGAIAAIAVGTLRRHTRQRLRRWFIEGIERPPSLRTTSAVTPSGQPADIGQVSRYASGGFLGELQPGVERMASLGNQAGDNSHGDPSRGHLDSMGARLTVSCFGTSFRAGGVERHRGAPPM
jgi:hypothetical protein